MSANNLLKTTEWEMQWPNKLIASQLLIFTIPVLEIWTHYFQLSEAPYISYGENYLD